MSQDQEMIIDTAFIMGDGTILSSDELGKHQKLMGKAMPGSKQSEAKDLTDGISTVDIVEPPFSPSTLSSFLENDETHFRCCKTKVLDSVGRDYKIVKRPEVNGDVRQVKAQSNIVRGFTMICNENEGFEGVLEKGAMDYESIGWAAFEVVRSFDKRIRNLYHIPAERIRQLKGFTGYIEQTYEGKNPKYYVPFGSKVVSSNRRKIDGTHEPYNPFFDGDIGNAMWHLQDCTDLNEVLGMKEIGKSANEILFIPKVHPKSIYYGLPDIIPALGSLLANINIRDYLLQYFDHNAIPQYAVIIKGAKLSEDVKKTIMQYFSSDIKGQAHKTLILPLPASGGDVEVEFKPLSTDTKEGSFQETRLNNQKAIVVAHGVSPSVIGMVESSSLGSGGGDKQADNYKNRVVDPMQKRWERSLNKLFTMGLGVTHVVLEFDTLDAEDLTAQRQNLVAFAERGIMSINEVREKAKIGPPVEGGEKPFILQGGIPLHVDSIEEANERHLEQLENDAKQIEDRSPDNKNQRTDKTDDDDKATTTQERVEKDHNTE